MISILLYQLTLCEVKGEFEDMLLLIHLYIHYTFINLTHSAYFIITNS